MIDVIVPIYGSAESLRGCVDSVLEHTEISFRLLLIDDASPGPEVSRVLEDAVRDSRCQVFRNDVNLGFAATVNRGLRSSRDDAVVLNSDVVVTRGWLEKMRACALSRPKVATVTPLTTEGSICAVPEWNQRNSLPAGYSLEEFAALVERLSARTYPQILTGVGFCMYVRREAIAEVGEFDAATFRHGYGEDSDFCMRAAARGFKHLLDDATFVYHEGGASFGSRKTELVEGFRQAFLEKHPRYLEQVAAFVAENPLRAIQTCIRKAIGGEVSPRVRVFVLRGHVESDVELEERQVRSLVAAVEGADLLVGRLDRGALIIDEFRDGASVSSERVDAPSGDEPSSRETYRSLLRLHRIQCLHARGVVAAERAALYAACEIGIPIVVASQGGSPEPWRGLGRDITDRVDAYVFPSRDSAEKDRMSVPLDPAKVHVIPGSAGEAYGDLYRALIGLGSRSPKRASDD